MYRRSAFTSTSFDRGRLSGLVSPLTERTIPGNTAMTGEISLRDLVLPVGGIKEKVIAAAQAGIKRVILPARNKRDFDDVPEEVRKRLEFVWIDRVDEAVSSASVQRTVITRPKRHNLPWFRDRWFGE